MASVPSRRVAIWIDHHEAMLLAFEVGPFDNSLSNRPSSGWSQHRVDVQQYPLMQQYYDVVLAHLEPGDEILILGPGQAKHELRQQIGQYGGLKGRVVGFHQAPRLAEVELVFPTSDVWRSGEADPAQFDTSVPRPVQEVPERSGSWR